MTSGAGAAPLVSLVSFSGHRQADVRDSADFRSWQALSERFAAAHCVWAGPTLRTTQGRLHVLRVPRQPGAASLLWLARAVVVGIRVVRRESAVGHRVVLNGGEPWGWLAAALTAAVVRRPWLMDLHADYLSLPAASVGRRQAWILRRTALLLARSATERRVVAENARDSLRLHGLSAVLVPPRLQPIWEQPLERAVRAQGGPVLSAVGRLVASKGFDVLVEAMPSVLAAFPDAQLRILGDGPERHLLERRIAKGNLGAAVHLLGSGDVERVRAELSGADLFVLSSRDEGLPRTLLEALSAEVPVVATRVGGIAAAAQDLPVLLMEPTTESLAAAILQALHEPPRPEQLAEARRAVLTRYGFTANIDELAALYARVVS